ncbi:lysozyme C-1 [Trematomus bernacchii]|uniref:lysozyme C-1 n=1 Tax=Trematomus bernacchii TaxID=40690 RepID=UPI00146DE8FF|nr:lysozyme C-1 [Trematomus bernacchii]
MKLLVIFGALPDPCLQAPGSGLLSQQNKSLAEGKVVSKCDLKKEFNKLPEIEWPEGHTMTDNFLAKLICHVEKASEFNTSSVNQLIPRKKEEEEAEQWTLYGLFQLSDHLICSDGATPSPDRICNVTCSALVDDHIEDDISCVLNIAKKVIDGGFAVERRREFWRMVRLIFQPDCNNETAGNYFAECKD